MRLETHSQAGSSHSLAFSPVSPLLASGGSDGMIRLWDIRTGTMLAALQGPIGGSYGIGAVAFSPDGSLLATGPIDRHSKLQLWDIATLTEIASFEATDSESLAWSPDGLLLACGGYVLTIRDGGTGEIFRELEGHTDWVLSVAWSQDGRLLASGSAFDEGEIRIWDVQTGREFAHLNQFQGYNIEEIVFRSDNEILYTTGYGKWLRWDMNSQPAVVFQAENVGHYPTAIGADGQLVAYADDFFWVEGEEDPDSLLLDVHRDNFSSIIHIVDIATRKYIATRVHFSKRVADLSAITFSPDGRWLASADTEGGLHVWQLDNS